MTGVLNGNRFMYIKQLPEGVHLPRSSHCAGLRCQIYHYGQPKTKRPQLCTNCWEDTHFRSQCKNNSRCKVCKVEGHNPGEKECSAYVEEQTNLVVTNGRDSVLSNFHKCDLDIFGMKHKSSEHAYQYVKAMRSGDLVRANMIRDCKTAIDAKRIGKLVVPTEHFVSQKESLMREILEAKAVQVPAFRDKLKKSNKSTIFVETTYDNFWGSGLYQIDTEHTDCSKWPGKNVFGCMLSEVAKNYRRPTRSWSAPRQSKDASQMDISRMMMRDIRTPQKRDRSGNRKPRTPDNSEGE